MAQRLVPRRQVARSSVQRLERRLAGRPVEARQ
jgi:hypothetical protein